MPFSAPKLLAMSNLRKIRTNLGMTQEALAGVFGCTKAMVSMYEKSRPVLPVPAATKLIEAARERGMQISYDDIYCVSPGNLAEQAA